MMRKILSVFVMFLLTLSLGLFAQDGKKDYTVYWKFNHIKTTDGDSHYLGYVFALKPSGKIEIVKNGRKIAKGDWQKDGEVYSFEIDASLENLPKSFSGKKKLSRRRRRFYFETRNEGVFKIEKLPSILLVSPKELNERLFKSERGSSKFFIKKLQVLGRKNYKGNESYKIDINFGVGRGGALQDGIMYLSVKQHLMMKIPMQVFTIISSGKKYQGVIGRDIEGLMSRRSFHGKKGKNQIVLISIRGIADGRFSLFTSEENAGQEDNNFKESDEKVVDSKYGENSEAFKKYFIGRWKLTIIKFKFGKNWNEKKIKKRVEFNFNKDLSMTGVSEKKGEIVNNVGTWKMSKNMLRMDYPKGKKVKAVITLLDENNLQFQLVYKRNSKMKVLLICTRIK